MNKPTKKQLTLGAGKTLQLKNCRRLAFVCNEGTAWVTNPGDQKDYIIRPGERLEIEVKSRRTPVVVGSFKRLVTLDVFTA